MTDSSPVVSIGVPRVFLSGVANGVGTSSIALGIGTALKKRKVTVSVGCVGSDLIQATRYRRITGTLTHSLDRWMLSKEQLREGVARLSSGAELLLFEGAGGLFDRSLEGSSVQNDGELANHLKAPVILILDARGWGESIAAQIFGFLKLYQGVKIAGVIANRVDDEAHGLRLKDAILQLQGPEFLGAVPFSEALEKETRAVAADENPSLLKRGHAAAAAELAERYIDLEAVKKIASEAKPFEVSKILLSSRSRACRVAVADDMAFHLTYQSNLDLLRREGAELVAFSPLMDRKLPSNVRAVYLPGGFPNLYASELSANRQMHQALRQFVDGGGVLYAEGSSLGFLARTMTLNSGTSLEMAGILPGDATLFSAKLGKRIPVEVKSVRQSVFTRAGERFRGYRDPMFVYRSSEISEPLFELSPQQGEGSFDGVAPKPNILSTTLHPLWSSNPITARNFIDSVLQPKSETV